MGKSNGSASTFANLKGWLVGLTSVLVVIPAVINAGFDIYGSFAKLPKSEAEKINVTLFQKYFNKQPVAAFPVPIKQGNGTVEVRFSVYEEGDVFVEFGRFTQWFPFPTAGGPGPVAFSLFPQAHAQANAPLRGSGSYEQSDRIKGDAIVRERVFQNGVTEKYTLNPRTGDIMDFEAQRGPRPAKSNAATGMPKITPIDLDTLRENRAAPTVSR
jgi:hypothetical protein